TASIASGSSSGTFTYTDTLAGSPTLTATDNRSGERRAGQAETVIAKTATHLMFSATPTLTAGVTSATITVTLDDAYNNVATASSTQTVLLTTTSTGTFAFTPTSASIASGSSSGTFTYTDTLAGSPTLTATDN